MNRELDRIDREIISIMQENARTPLKVIADKVFLSSPAVSARIDHLEKMGIIDGFYARINPEKLGYLIKAFIHLQVEPSGKKEFYEYIEKCYNVVECNYVTGEFSMVLEVLFRSTQELDKFVENLQYFGRTKTHIVFSTPVEHRGIDVNY